MESTGEVVAATKQRADRELLSKQVRFAAGDLGKILHFSIVGQTQPSKLSKLSKAKTIKIKPKKIMKIDGTGSI